jgi:hypothetical protein
VPLLGQRFLDSLVVALLLPPDLTGRRLEGQWERGDEISTEDLRVVLQRYRSLFQRLLNAGAPAVHHSDSTPLVLTPAADLEH